MALGGKLAAFALMMVLGMGSAHADTISDLVDRIPDPPAPPVSAGACLRAVDAWGAVAAEEWRGSSGSLVASYARASNATGPLLGQSISEKDLNDTSKQLNASWAGFLYGLQGYTQVMNRSVTILGSALQRGVGASMGGVNSILVNATFAGADELSDVVAWAGPAYDWSFWTAWEWADRTGDNPLGEWSHAGSFLVGYASDAKVRMVPPIEALTTAASNMLMGADRAGQGLIIALDGLDEATDVGVGGIDQLVTPWEPLPAQMLTLASGLGSGTEQGAKGFGTAVSEEASLSAGMLQAAAGRVGGASLALGGALAGCAA